MYLAEHWQQLVVNIRIGYFANTFLGEYLSFKTEAMVKHNEMTSSSLCNLLCSYVMCF